jgi:hypothetical protein
MSNLEGKKSVDTEFRLYELMQEIEDLSCLLDLIKEKFAELFHHAVTDN